MKIENKRLNQTILNLSESVKRRNEVAEYYFKNGIGKTMEHFRLTKQGVYSDVRAYKKFMSAYNLVSNAKTRKEFLNLNSDEIVPLFNNPRLAKFFRKETKLKDLDFSDKVEMRYKISGYKSFLQCEEFVKQHIDLIEGEKS